MRLARFAVLAAFGLAFGLSACDDGTTLPQPGAPILPPPPADFGTPVKVRAPRVGEDARAYAARERAGRVENERRLSNDKSFYERVQQQFGAP